MVIRQFAQHRKRSKEKDTFKGECSLFKRKGCKETPREIEYDTEVERGEIQTDRHI